jgi:hypothetical protein
VVASGSGCADGDGMCYSGRIIQLAWTSLCAEKHVCVVIRAREAKQQAADVTPVQYGNQVQIPSPRGRLLSPLQQTVCMQQAPFHYVLTRQIAQASGY